METLFTTLSISFVVIIAALLLLGIGWVLTGKVRIVRGACGMDPKKLRDKTCGTEEVHCELCKPEVSKERSENDSESV